LNIFKIYDGGTRGYQVHWQDQERVHSNVHVSFSPFQPCEFSWGLSLGSFYQKKT